MKLIKCHIDNFGKLHNLDIDFNDGCNLIAAENGWGKSTLAAFIKVMFYGFSGLSKKTDASIYNEKIRYTPWQNGSYGGTLEFEAAGKRYTIIRHFDPTVKTNDKSDVYELRDSKTNLITNDYVNLGLELFGVGAESFARTVFLGQGSCETQMNGEISAMIGNMVDDSNDINNFEAVDLKLKGILDNLNPNKKTGELYKKKEIIEKLKSDILRIEDVEQRLNRLVEVRRKAESEMEKLQSDKQQLQEKLDKVNNRKEQFFIAHKYEEAKSMLNDKQEEYDICRRRFGSKVPEEKELTDALKTASLLKQKREDIDRRKYEAENEEKAAGNSSTKKNTSVKNMILLLLSLFMMTVGLAGIIRKDVYKFVTETLSVKLDKPVFITVMAVVVCLGLAFFALYIKLKRERRGRAKIEKYEREIAEKKAGDFETEEKQIRQEQMRFDEFLKSIGIMSEALTEIPVMLGNLRELELA